ncbi:hypothetical protein JHW43_000285 [Diplocarpon mali]|nr:hypothetical protein JHW43_000285 [Diplocarpon mali]
MARIASLDQRPSPSFSNFSNFGDVRNSFVSKFNPDRSYGGIGQAILLPPMDPVEPRPDIFSYPESLLPANNLAVPANHLGLRSISSETQDIEMTAPALSRRQSQFHGMQLGIAKTSNPQFEACSYTRDTTLIESYITNHVTDAAFNSSRPYARLPVSDLLNGPTGPSGWGGHQHESQQAANQSSTINNNSRNGFDFPMTISRTSSTRSVLSSISSDSTIRPPFNIAEERCFLLNTLYHTCLDATASYAASLLPTSRHRHNQLPRHRHNQARFHPYTPPRSGYSRDGASNARPASLMDNISTISTHMWRKARCDDMAPHRAEAEAVRGMRDLYSWSEVVARGLDGEGIDDWRARGGGDGAGEETEDLGIRVGRAAKKLCQWLGDGQALHECHGLTRELRDLSEREALGGWISEIDDESDSAGDTC